MITTAELEAIPKFVAEYKRHEPQSRKRLFDKCAMMATKHPEPHVRELNALLYPELLRAEKELSPAEPKQTARPIVTPPEISAALLSVAKPLAGLFALGAGVVGIAYIVVNILSAIFSAVSAFISAGGWIIGPIIAFLAMAFSAKDTGMVSYSRQTGRTAMPGGQPAAPVYGAQNININITGSDGRINVNQQ